MDDLQIDRRQDNEHGFHAHVTDSTGKVWEVIVAPRGPRVEMPERQFSAEHWVAEIDGKRPAGEEFFGTDRQRVIEACLRYICDHAGGATTSAP